MVIKDVAIPRSQAGKGCVIRNLNLKIMNKVSRQTNPRSKRKYYFWKYDQYPYLLGGPGVRVASGGVETENFGKGFHFTPRYEFNLQDGWKFHQALGALKMEREKALEDVQNRYNHRLNELLNQSWIIDGVVLKC